MKEIDAIEITDEKTKARLERMKLFTIDEDSQILYQIDKQMSAKFVNKSIDEMEANQFDMKKSVLREDSSL